MSSPYYGQAGPKWRALRTIAIIFKIFAWIAGVGGIIAAVMALANGSRFSSTLPLTGIFAGLAELIAAGVVFLSLYGYAELILLLIAIEENTRMRRF